MHTVYFMQVGMAIFKTCTWTSVHHVQSIKLLYCIYELSVHMCTELNLCLMSTNKYLEPGPRAQN